MSAEELKALARRWQMMWNDNRPELAADCFAEACVFHDFGLRGDATGIWPMGPEPTRRMLAAWRTALPDYHVALDDVLVDGDRVVLNLTFSGTQTGHFRWLNWDIPPSGRRLHGRQIIIGRVVGGRFIELWSTWDRLAVLEQLGASPPPPLFAR